MLTEQSKRKEKQNQLHDSQVHEKKNISVPQGKQTISWNSDLQEFPPTGLHIGDHEGYIMETT